MGKHVQSVDHQVQKRIEDNPAGWVFTPADFYDLGSRQAVASAYAANLLGLSEQVPAKIINLTDGKTRTIKAGPMRILLKRTTPRNMAVARKLSGLLIQAFRNLGQNHVEAHHIERLRKNLPAEERQKIVEDLTYAPIWMHKHFREVALSHEPDARI